MVIMLPLSIVKFTGCLMDPTNLTSFIPAFNEFQKIRPLTKIAALKDGQFLYIFIWILLIFISTVQFLGIIIAIGIHRKLIQRKEFEPYPEDEIEELERIWSDLEIRDEIEPGVAILEYLDVDENLATSLFFIL
uniref:Uncharacterized protein n=1 Tax=Acrobeloides nanus TaxID=290746 RepID=A0A914DWL5_9BILA